MLSLLHVTTMARYNRWQNESLVAAAARLTDTRRRAELGAFFGSIHGTFCHLLWADSIWMHRFAGTPKPAGGIRESSSICSQWTDLAAQRQELDQVIVDWSEGLNAEWFDDDLTWRSAAVDREVTKPKWLLVSHFFNHQTHHRGQIHAMLTASGATPADTDLFLMPAAP